jgi:hypothetical protein
MLFLLESLSLEELADVARREGLVRDLAPTDEENRIRLRLPKETKALTLSGADAKVLLRRMLLIHFNDPLLHRPPSDLLL